MTRASSSKRLLALLLSVAMVFTFTPLLSGTGWVNAAEDEEGNGEGEDIRTVKSIEFTPASEHEVYEYTEGHMEGSGEDEYWYYDINNQIYNTGDILTVTYDDDSIVEYEFDENSDRFNNPDDPENDYLEDWALTTNADQETEHWVAGNEYEATLTYEEKETTVKIKVLSNPVNSISFEPAESITYEEHLNGYWYDEESDYFRYYLPEFEDGDKLTVNRKEGNVTNTYTCVENEEGEKVFRNDEVQDDIIRIGNKAKNVKYVDTQNETAWSKDSDNMIKVSYMGKECEVPVSINENPVDSIQYSRTDEKEMYSESNGDIEEDEEGDSYFLYDYDSSPFEGDKLTVNYKSGDSVTYIFSYESDAFVNTEDSNETISRDSVSFDTNQEKEHWKAGHDNKVTVEYKGKTCTYNVEIKDNPVERIDYRPAKPFEFDEYQGGYWDWETNDYYYYMLNFNENDYLDVNYKDGTKKTYKFTEDEDGEGVFVNITDNNDVINTGSDNETSDNETINISSKQSPENPFTVEGPNKAVISYMGRNDYEDVIIRPSNIKSIDYLFEGETEYNKYTLYEKTYGENSIDENEEQYYDYYGKSVVGLKVTYLDDSIKTYVLSDDPYADGEYVNEKDKDDAPFQISDGDLSIDDNQYTDHWNINNTYQQEFSCRGIKTPVTVEIIKSPVKKIEFESDAKREVEFDDKNEDRYSNYFLNWESFRDGDILKVTYTEESQKDPEEYVYNSDDESFIEKTSGKEIDMSLIQIQDGQDESEWKVGSDNYNYVSYMGLDNKAKMYITVLAEQDDETKDLIKDISTAIEEGHGLLIDEKYRNQDEVNAARSKINGLLNQLNALSDEQKKTITDSWEESLKDELESIKVCENLGILENEIDALPDADKLTEADLSRVEEKITEYFKLLEDEEMYEFESAMYEKASKLKDKVEELKGDEGENADQKAANAVIKMINDLPANPGVGDESKVQAVLKAFNSLTEKQKALISDAIKNKLTAAETAIKKAKENNNKTSGENNDKGSKAPAAPVASVANGKTYKVAAQSYKVTKVAAGQNKGNVTFMKAKNAKSVVVPATVKLADGKVYNVSVVGVKAFAGKKIRTVTIGKNVTKITAKAFVKSKATKMIVKTKKLKKATVKGSLKGSKIKTISVKVGSKKVNKKQVRKYKKIFTKKNAGRKVKVQ